jgi:anti-anti-sigma regulatory factor
MDPSITAAQYISACRSILVDITGVSFVDDTGLGVTSD